MLIALNEYKNEKKTPYDQRSKLIFNSQTIKKDF